MLIGGVLFLRWFHCAYRRLAAATPTAYRPIWAIVGWVVPGLNLVRPPKIMAELTIRAGLTGAWWLLWLLGGGVQVALRFIAPETQQGWVNWQATALMANLVLLSSLAFGVVLINLSRRRPFRAPPPLIRSDRGRYPDRHPGRDPGFDPDRAA